MRSWSTNAGAPASLMVGTTWTVNPAFGGAPEVVYELPSVAQIAQVSIQLDDTADPSNHIDVAASTTTPANFADVGTISFANAQVEAVGTLAKPFAARWLRLRFNRAKGAIIRVESVAATGTMTVPPARMSGHWDIAYDPSGSGDHIFPDTLGALTPLDKLVPNDPQAETYERDGTFAGGVCDRGWPIWHGPVQSGSAGLGGSDTLQSVAGGALLVGIVGGSPFIARRVSHTPNCDLPDTGRGPEILVIKRRPVDLKDQPPYDPGHLVRTTFLPGVDASELARAQTAILENDCKADADLSPDQERALLDYVHGGHVLIVRDADTCSSSSYTFMPYPFTTNATGARGSRGNTLLIADSSILGSTDATDRAHFVDVGAYLANTGQQIGDADIMETADARWCGLFFAQNAIGRKGWIEAYARYGEGVIVYSGYDSDDSLSHIPQALQISRLQYALSPRSDLPCSARVADGLVILSSTSRAVAFGRPADLKFRFIVEQDDVVASRRIAMSLTPSGQHGLTTRIVQRAFNLGAAPQPVNVGVHVPASLPAGNYLLTLAATADNGQVARASILLSIDEALAKQLEKGGRARIYGIHFDVASAKIQPRSQATLREIADVLHSHPKWRMRVEGYTDSDGGAAYNQGLSVRRARAVVADLVKHYGIASGRLTAAGYGMARPVAPNATEAGKALNRRVELVRI
jgi:outer membrane protein OmpA-like peptidoglycan-associated protein